MIFKNDDLGSFYSALKAGLTVENFLRQYAEIIQFVHSAGWTENFRLGRGRVKRLRDEIVPAARFVREHADAGDRISFTLDSSSHDCVVCAQSGRKRTIEVTIADGQTRLNTMGELNDNGSSRGFIGVPEGASKKEFTDAMKHKRQPYSTHQVIEYVEHALERCTNNKEGKQADILPIGLDLSLLPASQWPQFLDQFH